MKKIFSKILVLLLAVLLSVNVPISALAESIPLDTEIVADDNASLVTPVMNENGGYSIGSYTYTPPKSGKFWIQDVEGTLTITDDTPVITFADFTVTVPAFDWYKIASQGNEEFFYRADVLKSPENANNFVYAAVQTPISFLRDSSYALYLQYFVEAENRMYNIKAIITEAQFFFFDHLSNPHSMGNDDLSERLKLSANVYTDGTFENRGANEVYSITSNNMVVPTALNPISANSYDDYTNADGILKFYASDYYGENLLPDGITVTDDPIVQIVPKELCFIPGEHIYVGKEYGFFIRVFEPAIFHNGYNVDIMVFDITHVTPSFLTGPDSETGSTKIEPLFQYRYQAKDRTSVLFGDPNLSQLVISSDTPDSYEYHLKDIGFRFTLDNPTELNPGEVGYDAYEDNGAFIIQNRISMSGVGLRQKEDSFIQDTVLFALGFVPYVGTAISILSYVNDVNNGFGNGVDGSYFYTRPEMTFDNEATINTEETNSTDQIWSRGGLIKSQAISLKANETKPQLIHVDGGYVEAKYVVARKSGSTYNKIRVVTSVSVEVVEDKTTNYGGELISYGRSTGTYETSGHKRLDDVILTDVINQFTIPANALTNLVKITPTVSGTYLIRTQSTQGDPHFRITNATAGTSHTVATTDISATNKNAELTIYLEKGNIYYLEAFHHETLPPYFGQPHDYTVRIGYAPEATQILEEDTPLSVTTADGTFEMLAFTPSSSGLYWLSADDSSADVQLFSFSPSGQLVDINSYISDPNLQQEYYLDSENTYYIAVQGHNGDAIATTVFISSTYY